MKVIFRKVHAAAVLGNEWMSMAQLPPRLVELQRVSAELAADRGTALCEQGDVPRGMLWLVRGIELAQLVCIRALAICR